MRPEHSETETRECETETETNVGVVMPCGWGVKAGMVVCGWQIKLCDPLVTRGPYLSTIEIRSLYIKCYINLPSLLYQSSQFSCIRN